MEFTIVITWGFDIRTFSVLNWILRQAQSRGEILWFPNCLCSIGWWIFVKPSALSVASGSARAMRLPWALVLGTCIFSSVGQSYNVTDPFKEWLCFRIDCCCCFSAFYYVACLIFITSAHLHLLFALLFCFQLLELEAGAIALKVCIFCHEHTMLYISSLSWSSWSLPNLKISFPFCSKYLLSSVCSRCSLSHWAI